MERESFKSRLGFLLVSAGCAIGIGNVWKFPFVTGQNGGGVFVLFYLLFLVIMGAPVLTMELAVGRASRRSAVGGYRALEPEGSRWHLHGWVAIGANYLLMMYYTTVSGWMLSYFVKFLTGAFDGVPTEAVGGVFDALLARPGELGLYMAVTVVVGIAVCSFELQKGVERITKVMMVGLLGLIVVLAVHSMTLPRAGEGLAFYLLPDFGRAAREGLGHVVTAAMNQAFFTLSLGVASMEIFGSYMSKERTLVTESGWIIVLDTFVALCSGLIIFPACACYGVQPDKGPALIFATLPRVFGNMPAGRLWGTLFFLFMSFASLSTVIAVFENIIRSAMDNFGWSRGKSAAVNLVILLLGSVPCVLGFNLWSGVQLLGPRGVLDSEDFLVTNLLLPSGALVYLLFCTTKWGWGFDNYLAEVNTGKGVKLAAGLKYYFRWVLPILILVILIQGLIG